jgi:hypothetical protein
MTKTRRVFADCRALASDSGCSLYIAGTVEEVLDIAVAHAVKSHGHEDTPEFRDLLRASLRDEPPGR